MKAIIAIPITVGMVYRAHTHKSLTPAGIVAAIFTAIAHAVHPWSLPFALLIVFFLAGTRVTKIKHDVKAKLTIQSTGNVGGEGARTHVQVLANSLVASVLTLLHAYQLHKREQKESSPERACYSWPGDILVVGIIANYAAVAADTFSSELGILSKSHPRLLTSLTFRRVPPGTNGGVTSTGLASGFLGSLVIVAATMALVPFCAPPVVKGELGWNIRGRNRFSFAMAIWGFLGSVLDSLLGGWFQASIVDTRTGKIVEGEGGKKVLVSKSGPSSLHVKKGVEVKARLGKGSVGTHNRGVDEGLVDSLNTRGQNEKPSRMVESGGLGLLDNNQVNFLMALIMSLGAMGVASWFWGVPLSSIFEV